MKIGDVVYLLTGDDQRARYITGILERETGKSYALTCGTDNETWHYSFEFSKSEPKAKPKDVQVKGLKP